MLVYTFGPESDYGPFIFQDEAGNNRGLSLDFLNLLAKKIPLRIETMPARPLSEILKLAREGGVDIISSLRPTSERLEYLQFTKPYISAAAVLATLSSQEITSIGAFNGKKVAVGKGYAVESFVRDRFPKVLWVATQSDLASVGMLARHEVDAVVADVYSLSFIADKLGVGLAPGIPVGFEYLLSFAYRRDLPQLGLLLDRGLQAITQDERRAIFARWLPKAVSSRAETVQASVVVLTLVSLGLGALLLAASFIRLYLKKGRGSHWPSSPVS